MKTGSRIILRGNSNWKIIQGLFMDGRKTVNDVNRNNCMVILINHRLLGQ